jgi:hypothetical protein
MFQEHRLGFACGLGGRAAAVPGGRHLPGPGPRRRWSARWWPRC